MFGNRFFKVFLSTVLFLPLAANARAIKITPDNSSQLLRLGRGLACYAEGRLLGSLKNKGTTFRTFKPRAKIRQLRKKLGALSARKSRRVLAARIRAIKAASRICAAWDPSRSSSSASQGSQSSQSSSESGTLVSSISQYGITWTFDKAYQAGQFINGDWWVVGPVTITSVEPAPKGEGAAFRNGSMLDPTAGDLQGYDGRTYNFASQVTVNYPVSLEGARSLVSTISNPEQLECTGGWNDTFIPGLCHDGVLKTAAVLTVLDAPAPSDAFRPPFAGADKRMYRRSQLDLSILPRLPLIASAPAAGAAKFMGYERRIERPWLSHKASWTGEYLHPTLNQPKYYREAYIAIQYISSLLLLAYPEPDLERLAIKFVQLGLDQFGIAKTGYGSRGFQKAPIIFASLALRDQTLSDVPGSYFMTDYSTYNYDDSDLPALDSGGAPLRGVEGWTKAYTSQGAAALFRTDPTAWYEHKPPSLWTDGQCKAEEYRRTSKSYNWVGIQLAAVLIPGMKEAWKYDAFFDYVDRWMTEDCRTYKSVIEVKCGAGWGWANICRSSRGPNFEDDSFIDDMWSAYR